MFLAINCASLREPQNRSIGAIARWWGAARPGQGPTHNATSTETGMLPLRGPLNMPGGRLWREHGRLEQRQAPAGAGAWPGALAAGWQLAAGVGLSAVRVQFAAAGGLLWPAGRPT